MSIKFGSAEQLVSRNEAAPDSMIYTITTWRLLVVSGWWLGLECWNVVNRDSSRFSSCERQPFSFVDHQNLPCALCCGSAIDTYGLSRHVKTCSWRRYQFFCLLSVLNCSAPMSAIVSKSCETLGLMETLATRSNLGFCFVEIGRVRCFSPLAHVFHVQFSA